MALLTFNQCKELDPDMNTNWKPGLYIKKGVVRVGQSADLYTVIGGELSHTRTTKVVSIHRFANGLNVIETSNHFYTVLTEMLELKDE